MSETVYELEYQPTAKEIRTGSGMLAKAMYSPLWLRLCQLQGVIVGVSFGLTGFLVSILLLKAFGLEVADAAPAFYIMALAVGLALMLFSRQLGGLPAMIYAQDTQARNQTLRLSASGLEIKSETEQLHYAWAAFRRLSQSKSSITLLLGSTGYVLPARLLNEAAPEGQIADDIKRWFEASRAIETA